MADLFVSYKAEDRPRVARLVEALEAEGIPIWWDAHIGAGDEWRDAILRELESARCVMVVWSKRSIGPDGHFVRDEATRALRRHVYLPVLIDRVDPPLGFGETQAIDLSGWSGDRSDRRFRSALAAIRSRLGLSGAAAVPASASPRLSRRAAMAGGAVALASAAGLAGWHFLRTDGSAADGIAVLPFANLSGDPAQAYFSDGIAEELRTALSRIAGLKVVARTSSEAVRDADAKTAAERLGVANILTGSVRRSPAMIRISAQLVDGKRGMERWSATYDRPVGDALQIQTDIADKVADALSIRLGGADRSRIVEGATSNPAAHDLLLRAVAYAQQNEGAEALGRAIGMVDGALALDPNYADAVVAKAGMLKILAGAFAASARESRQLYAEAERTARRAIQLAPRSAAGPSVLAGIYYERLQPRAALAQYRKMLALPGEDAEAHRAYAIFLGETGHTEEALRQIDRGIAIDPLNAQNYGWKAYILAAARRYPEAITAIRETMKMTPGRTSLRLRLGFYLALQGKYAEAAKAMDVPGPYTGVHQVYQAYLAIRTGRKEEAERILAQLRPNDYASYQVADILAQLSRKDEAIAALEDAWTARDSGLTTILFDPLLDPLRGDPRFEAIVKRIDFPK